MGKRIAFLQQVVLGWLDIHKPKNEVDYFLHIKIKI
jgi:hypothetical protein